MALWLVRAGSQGERENFNFEHNVVAAGWARLLRDLSEVRMPQDLGPVLLEIYPTESVYTRGNWKGQLWFFVAEMQTGDLVVTPLKERPYVAVGEITSPYFYVENNDPDYVHLRKIKKWVEIPRDLFDDDIDVQLKAPLTIRLIRCVNAEKRVRKLIGEAKHDFSQREKI
jgi:restriction system protein